MPRYRGIRIVIGLHANIKEIEIMENVKYLESGQEVRVIEKVGNRWLVEPILHCDEFNEPFMGNEFIADKVFDTAPVEKYCAEIDSLNNKIKENRKILGEIASEMHNSKKELDGLFKELEKIPALKNLKSVLDGDFKYFANVDDYQGPSIKESLTLLDSDDSRFDANQKLLTLYGKTKGDLSWKLNQYSDGSGHSNKTVMPCKTHEEAMKFIKDRCLEYVNDVANRGFKPWAAVGKAKWLTDNGFDLPEKYIEVYGEYKKEEDSKRIKKLNEQISKDQDELNSLCS